jgi:hypothetical protein
MLPRDHDIRNLALYHPKIAFGLVAQVPRVPFVGGITTNPGVPSPLVPIEFKQQWIPTGAVPDAPIPVPPPVPPVPNNIGKNPIIVGTLQNNVVQDTLIERITFSLFQPAAFTSPPSPFQTLYLSQLRAATGLAIMLDVYGAPKYRVSDFTPLENLMDVLAVTWPNGWPLAKQSNVKVSAVMTRGQPFMLNANDPPPPPPFPSYVVNIALVGWQFLDKMIDDMSDAEARRRLKALGIEVAEVKP